MSPTFMAILFTMLIVMLWLLVRLFTLPAPEVNGIQSFRSLMREVCTVRRMMVDASALVALVLFWSAWLLFG